MLSIIFSTLEQLFLFISIIFTDHIFYNSKLNYKKIFIIIGIFIIILLGLLFIHHSYPVTILNVIFLFCLYCIYKGKLSIKEFLIIYINIGFINVFMTVLLDYMGINDNSILVNFTEMVILFVLSKYYFYLNSFTINIMTTISLLFSIYLVLIINMNVDVTTFILSISITLLTIMIMIYLNYQYHKRMIEENKNKQYTQMIDTQNQYINHIMKQYDELSKFRHDYKAQLLTMNNYISNNDYQSLLEYMNSIKMNLNIKRYSSNQLLDCIFSYFDDIDLIVHDSIVGTIDIDDQQLSSLFYNLISNAYEAAIESPHPKIEVLLNNMNTSLHIVVKNSVSDSFDISHITNKQTTKPDKKVHGIGLSIINDIVNDYNGIIKYDYQDSMLINDIVLFDVIK